MRPTLMIVDDEPRQRGGLVRIIAKLYPSLCIIEAGNGEEAISLALRQMPDILLTDIRMPIIDGLELIEHLGRIEPNLIVVVISAYQDFHYATTALRLGVVDYLTKPFQMRDIERMLSHTLELLEKREAQAKEIETLKNRHDDFAEAYRERLMRMLFKGPLLKEEYQKAGTFIDISAPGCVLACYGIRREDILDENEVELLNNEVMQYLQKEMVGLFCLRMIERPIEIWGIQSISPGSGTCIDQNLLENLRNELRKKFGVAFMFAVSDIFEPISEYAHIGYKQAVYTLSYRFYMQQGGVLLYRDIEPIRNRELPYLYRHEQALIKCVETVDNELLPVIDRLFSVLYESPHYPPEKLIRKLHQMARKILGSVESRMPATVFEQLWVDCGAVFNGCNSFTQLKEDFYALMRAVMTGLHIDLQTRTEWYVDECIQYIRTHFSESLSLGDVASIFHFSANYLSQLIKSRTGLSFNHYITRIRMEKACELLLDKNDRVSSIAQAVGYEDPAYFNRIFKQKCGVSPEQYRRNMKPRMR